MELINEMAIGAMENVAEEVMTNPEVINEVAKQKWTFDAKSAAIGAGVMAGGVAIGFGIKKCVKGIKNGIEKAVGKIKSKKANETEPEEVIEDEVIEEE